MSNTVTMTLATDAQMQASNAFAPGHQGAVPTDIRYQMNRYLFRDASGNVGAGTFAPVSALHVLKASSIYWTGTAFTGPTTAALTISNSNNGGYDPVIIGQMADSAGGLHNVYAVGATSTANWAAGNAAAQKADYYIALRNDSATLVERMRITSAGAILPGADNAQALGSAAKRWSTIFAASGTINTSDKNLKEQIGDIPEAWLDAWGDVQRMRFKTKDSASGRWHIGLIAQDVHAVFAAHGIDAFDIGLMCKDEFPEIKREIIAHIEHVDERVKEVFLPVKNAETGEIEQVRHTYNEDIVRIEQKPTGTYDILQEASEVWGLRYDECHEMDAAWQRREYGRAALKQEQVVARIAALEAQIAATAEAQGGGA
jgi:hypothetical protein